MSPARGAGRVAKATEQPGITAVGLRAVVAWAEGTGFRLGL
ncbi:hypothetical protein ACIPVK_03565 [Paeniglutamicibacter sp. MACA_103]